MTIDLTAARDFNTARSYSADERAQLTSAIGYGVTAWTDAALLAVADWQASRGLAPDAKVGPKTLAALPSARWTTAVHDYPGSFVFADEIRALWPHLTFFADISAHQEVGDWATFAEASPICVIKVSEGVHHTDPRFSDHWAKSKAHGVRRAGYHYAHHAWRGKATDPIPAADAFWRRLEADPGELPCILDLEGDTTRAALEAGMSPAQIVDWSMRWLGRVQALSGTQPIVYNNRATIVQRLGVAAMAPLLAYPQWMAAYISGLRWPLRGPVSPYTTPAPPWQADAWQFTSTGRAAGVVGSIDINVVLPHGRLAGVLNPPPTKATSC